METEGSEGHKQMHRDGIMTNSNESMLLPPVVLDNYDDFRKYAKESALVTYEPEYFNSPFLDDKPMLRRVTFYAIGVKVRDLPLTFKYVLDYTEIHNKAKTWNTQTEELDKMMTKLLTVLRSQGTLVQGTIESERALGEALVMRP